MIPLRNTNHPNFMANTKFKLTDNN